MKFPQYLKIAIKIVQQWGWAMQMALLLAGLMVRPGNVMAQNSANEMRRFCVEDEERCLKDEYDRFDSCMFVYIKQTAWFGLIDRWYVYSIRGGPTVSLLDFNNSVYIDRRDAVRATDNIARLLNEIGLRELRKCDVNSYLKCVDDQELNATICRQSTIDGVAKWEMERLTPEEVRDILELDN